MNPFEVAAEAVGAPVTNALADERVRQ